MKTMKNIHVFQTELPVHAELQKLLDDNSGLLFKPCDESQAHTRGFQPELCALDNGFAIQFTTSFKTISKGALSVAIENKIKQIEEEDQRVVDELGEQLEISAQVRDDLIKVTPYEIRNFNAYYHTKSQLLIVDGTQEQSQQAVSLLIRLLGSLPTTTLHCDSISNSLSSHTLSSIDNKEYGSTLVVAGFEIGDLLVLQNDEKDVARFKGDYPLDQIRELLFDGYEITQVNLVKDSMSFNFSNKFKITGIKNVIELDELTEQEAIDLEDYELLRTTTELELLTSHITDLRNFFDMTEKTTIQSEAA
jgi:DNA recombination-dependent growth factor C